MADYILKQIAVIRLFVTIQPLVRLWAFIKVPEVGCEIPSSTAYLHFAFLSPDLSRRAFCILHVNQPFIIRLLTKVDLPVPLGPNRKNEVRGIFISRFISMGSAKSNHFCIIHNNISIKKERKTYGLYFYALVSG